MSRCSQSGSRGRQPSILYQNAGQDLTIIDIPTSIAEAGADTSDARRRLISCSARESPYQSHAPKNGKLASTLQGQVGHALDLQYSEYIRDSLGSLKASFLDEWCLPRVVLTHETKTLGKRRRSDDEHDHTDLDGNEPDGIRSSVQQPVDLTALPSRLARASLDSSCSVSCNEHSEPDEAESRLSYEVDEQGLFASNNSLCSTGITVDDKESNAKVRFYIPPDVTFCLGNCFQDAGFHAYVRNQAAEHDKQRHFDLVTMDPPWPNASVKRGHKRGRGHYKSLPTLRDMKQLLLSMDIDVLVADQSLLGVWITNKRAVRDLVLGENGLFDHWGVELEEEWLWIKTTTKGEPVLALDDLWRKPYELFLLGRRSRLRLQPSHDDGCVKSVRRRLIAAVPDLHSRKPCLKQLLEPLISRQQSYKALEIFARNLVSGWWSWGNEVLKFNDECCWVADE